MKNEKFGLKIDFIFATNRSLEKCCVPRDQVVVFYISYDFKTLGGIIGNACSKVGLILEKLRDKSTTKCQKKFTFY